MAKQKVRPTKVCQYCTLRKDLDDFYIDQSEGGALHEYCKDCTNRDETDEVKVKLAEKKFYPTKLIVQVSIKSTENKPRKVSERTKYVIMMDPNTGEELKEFRSASIAAASFDKSPASIRSMLRGATKTAHGYKWKYKT